MKKVKFIVFICLFILLPLAYFNGFIRISDLTSEQESIAKKYGGVYVFDEKLEKEIDKREKERNKYLDDFFKSNNRDFDLNDQTIMNEKLPRVLSNGKKYYVTTRDYGNDFKKQAWMPREYSEKINEFIGKENLENRDGKIFVNLNGKKLGSSAIVNNLTNEAALLIIPKETEFIAKGEVVEVLKMPC